jgi:hypothetical protein
MIQPPRDNNEQLAMDAFQGLQPFTITINRADDAMFLSLTLLGEMTGDKDLTNEAMKLIINHARFVGVDKAVDHFFEQAESENISYPDFLKPVLKIMVFHIFEHKERIGKLIDKAKEKES